MQTLIAYVKYAFLVPVPCYLCGQPTQDAIFKGTAGAVPACVRHINGIERAQLRSEVGAASV